MTTRRWDRLALVASAAGALGAWFASGVIAPEAADASRRVGAFAPIWLLGVLLVGAWAAAAFAKLTARAAAPLWLPLVSVLPWLPVPLPPAALLAVGPLGQLLVATSALFCIVAVAFERRGVQDVGTRAAIPVLLLAALFSASAWWVSPRIPGGDEPHYLIITQSLLTDGDLRIEDNHRRRDYAAYADGELKPDYLRRGRDGAIYSVHAPGVSAVLLPGFALAGYPGAVLTLVLLGTLGMLAVWSASRDLTGNVTAASVATAGVGLSVPFFFQTFTIYPDGPASVGVAVVVWLALVRPGDVTWQRALACGAVLGALPWMHTRYAAIAGPLGMIVAGRLLWPREASFWPVRARALAAFALPAVVSGVAWLSMFLAIYGTWDPRAPYGHATDMRWARIPHGVTGLLLDQQFGLLPNAPIYVVALAGFAALWRRDRRLTAELLVATAPYVAAVAGFHMWWGGQSSPARFLVPVLLPLALPLAAWWTQATSRTARAVTLLLLVASVCLTAALVLVDHGGLIYNARDGHALWLLAADPSVNLTYAFPSLFQAGPAAAWVVAAAWFVAATLGWLTLRRVERCRQTTGPWLASVLGTAVLVVACGTSLGWALSPGVSWDSGSGLVAVARRACDPRATGVRSSPAGVGRVSGLLLGVPIADASRRPPRDNTLHWAAEDVPPGSYRLVVLSGLNVSGTVRVALGRRDQTWTSCTFADRAPGPTECVMALPAGASALWVDADAAMARTVERLAMTLVEPGAADACGLRAQRALTTPAGPMFVVGGRAWAEGAGLWTAGGGEVALVAERPASTLSLRIRQGGAAGAVNLRSGAWSDARQLAAGEVWDVDVPHRAAERIVPVTIATAAAFRPSDLDASSSDTRVLGAWVEPR
jgi:hypothetical protein